MQMNAVFSEHVLATVDLFRALDSVPAIPIGSARLKAVPAVYIFLEEGVPKHVGRTRNLKGRIQGHRTHSDFSASFAFKLARFESGRHKASYRAQGSRAALMKDDLFVEIFRRQLVRVGSMSIRFIEVADPLQQYLLELYAAIEYGTSLSEFDTH